MELHNLIMPMGIVTYLLVAAAAISGKMKVRMKTHIIIASFAILAATLHAFLVIYYH